MTAQNHAASGAADWGLTKVGGRPPLLTYLRELARRRQFVASLARFKIEAENQRNRLGMAWVILKPMLNAAAFGLVFGILMQSRKSTPNFVEFLVIGVFMFEFFASSLSSGAKSISSNAALVQSLAFPRMALPISVVTQKFLQLLPALAIMLVLLVMMGHRPTPEWLLLVPLVGLFYVFNVGLVLIAARITVHFRDFVNFLPFATRLVFYTTGIFFAVEIRFAGSETFLRIMDFQPIYVFLTLARTLLLDGHAIYEMRPEYWITAAVWSLILLVAGIVFFWSAEERYGRVD